MSGCVRSCGETALRHATDRCFCDADVLGRDIDADESAPQRASGDARVAAPDKWVKYEVIRRSTQRDASTRESCRELRAVSILAA